jgi:hypothetical protein
MASQKLYDYNSSFGLLRTNPKITGNVKITVDSESGVWLNSMDANSVLSSQRFKKYRVSGENSYAKDLQIFFDNGTVPSEVIFEVGKFTDGENKSVETFSQQYDFFYGCGASNLIDRNYPENFKYFQPLWIKDELPEFFVIFKIPEPISYPYTTNVTSIQNGVEYKIIKDPNSTEIFKISYGLDNTGSPIFYEDGQFFTGLPLYSTYTIVSGTGKVVEFNELKFQPQVQNVESFFNSQVLPNSRVVATYDLRENTTIGNYIRDIQRNPGFSNSPIDFSFQLNTYTYFNGVNVNSGTFGKKGELLYEYLISNQSTVQSDFENYVTSGFERNKIICANLLNLEFLFNDTEADLYTINRYFGCYVSKNDLGEFVLNGDYFFKFKNEDSNLNLPKPTRNNLGYYYNNLTQYQSSTGGVRLFYEQATGWIPGSYDVNVNDPQKLYYITDKNDNFYSLSRNPNYNESTQTWTNNTPEYQQFGPYYQDSGFGVTGDPFLRTGSLVIHNKSVNLQNFTGVGKTLGSFFGVLPDEPGKPNIDIEFIKPLNQDIEATFVIYWPNGTQGDLELQYDFVKSGSFGGTLLGWRAGSSYNVGNNHFFNPYDGDSNDVSNSFSKCILSISDSVWDSASIENTTAIRIKNVGFSQNTVYRVAVFSDYPGFENSYAGIWDNTSSFSIGDIVYYSDKYFESISNIVSPSPGNFNQNPEISSSWIPYYTFSEPGYIKIGGVDASTLSQAIHFKGGTDYTLSRVAFSILERDKIVPGVWVEVEKGSGVTGGYSMISSVTRYVDSPVFGTGTEKNKVIGFSGYNEFLVANLADQRAIINLGSDSRFNVSEMASLKSGVFSFFDLKDFDFDFWSSVYGVTPTPEAFRYFQLIPNQSGQILSGVKYVIREGQVLVDEGTVNERILTKGRVFIGTSVSYFLDVGLTTLGVSAVVVPAAFTQIGWSNLSITYPIDGIKAEQNLDSFDGFYGIQSIVETTEPAAGSNKMDSFEFGKLQTEYQYLEENFTQKRANRSKIVPFINKWGYLNGTDARGNVYRLNVSPAFSPTNFSPSFQKDLPDPRYLTHEWMLLEGVPLEFPVDAIGEQNEYLPSKVDLSLARDANPINSGYLNSFFIVEPTDYPAPYSNPKNDTKEFFTPLVFNSSNGFYETVFRGVKIVLKRRSTLPNPTTDLDKFVPNYRGFEGYNFSSILRVVPENSSLIQSPVSYEFIENTEQKFILFVCTVVINDYRTVSLRNTGGTGSPYLDHVLMYSLKDKKRLTPVGTFGAPGPTGSPLYAISDIKLSSALDLSVVSDSSVTTTTNPGSIFILPNPDYDTDLREEINLFYPVGSTGSVPLNGPGSFSVPGISSFYPWPTGRSQNLVNFGPISPPSYVFTIPFAFSNPVTIPIGSQSSYANNPVTQIGGGELYFNFIMKRISLSQISERVNGGSQYVKYRTYSWDENSQTTVEIKNYFEIDLIQPTSIYKPKGVYPVKDFSGPQTLGQTSPTGYSIVDGGKTYASDILRYGGKYEPLFKKIFKFKRDKNDTINGYPSVDLSFRNCTFAPEKNNFGTIINLNYSKVSLGKNILESSQNIPQGPVFPLIEETPIARKNLSVFESSWDPGYYNLYTSSNTETPVAGTRSMKEDKSFLGSKIMQTPAGITIYTFISLECSLNNGTTNIQEINVKSDLALQQIQNISPSTSNTGIGQLGTFLSPVDLPILDEGLFPNVEVFWQKIEQSNKVIGSIRLDRILKRFLLNSGINSVFVNNIISEFGVGNPNSIDDDIRAYIDQNILPIYEGITFELFVKKTGTTLSPTELLVRGDLVNPDRIRYSYYPQTNFNLVKKSSLIYTFDYPLEFGQNYSLTFSFQIQKI